MLTITVSDPKKESEGINSYISYKVRLRHARLTSL